MGFNPSSSQHEATDCTSEKLLKPQNKEATHKENMQKKLIVSSFILSFIKKVK